MYVALNTVSVDENIEVGGNIRIKVRFFMIKFVPKTVSEKISNRQKTDANFLPKNNFCTVAKKIPKKNTFLHQIITYTLLNTYFN